MVTNSLANICSSTKTDNNPVSHWHKCMKSYEIQLVIKVTILKYEIENNLTKIKGEGINIYVKF